MAMAIVVSGNNSPRSSIFPTAPVPRSFATTFVRRHQLRSVRLQIRCISSNHLSTEFSGTYDSPSESHFSMLSPGVKRFQNVIVVILIFIHISYPLPLSNWIPWFISPARAVLYSPDTKVPRTGELALRKAIPANSNMKAIQNSLEEISYLLRIPQRKPYGTMEGDVKRALKGELQSLVESIKENDPDKVSIRLSSSLNTVAELELLQAPGLSFLLPKQYMGYPRLTGRGTVEFTIEKGDGSTFSSASSGEPRKNVTIQVVLDGYSAPLTAGNFAKLVIDGAYDGVKLKCTDQAVLPDNEVENSGYSVPLEIMPSGQFEPLYKTTLSVQDGELPVLPLSVYGAVAMAHNAVSEEYSSPFQFFFYLYDKRNAGLGGLSFEEGQFSVFGYTTVGREILPQIKTGDLIRSAKLVQGQDHLTLPVEK
ncbi:cyclophilin-like peptidyl-prolyl cis-trans isomerase family protein isoform X2 [Tasmannia lanceolata]|uniref:cyclophilin-like peptidyl-prolyl cis-trans isomerase family protein isoform X2 n=1 Tax=Tasmannia lanceolata TaxID=3420 RepID=UPI0040636A93